MNRRRVAPVFAVGLVTLTIASCSNRATDLMGDYDAGFDAGTALPEDDWKGTQQRECGDLTQKRYDGDGGLSVDSADGAAAFSLGCFDGLFGHEPKSSHEVATWLDEEDKGDEGD